MINVALDVSKGLSHYVIIQNDAIVDEGIVYHNKISFKKFYDMLHYLDEIPNVIFEATGVYSKPLERFFTDFEINYKVVNSLAAHLKLQSLRQNKTDVSDARVLASIANDPVFMTHSKVGDSYEQLKTLSNNYLQIIEDIKVISSRIRRGLELSFPEMNKLFNPITSTLAYNLYKALSAPRCSNGYDENKIEKSNFKEYE
ncbi:IS110 family transposase [Weissella paramesenteroides]|uniref:IS110 family transposase n=1 Tax=Weissella paramesenteroides TaxID=1249 RepID=UPI003F743D87